MQFSITGRKSDEKIRSTLEQKLQNLTPRKILKAFRTSSVAVIKIEANVSSMEIRLNQKSQKLALRIIKMRADHVKKRRTSINFRLNEIDDFEENDEDDLFDRNSKFVE